MRFLSGSLVLLCFFLNLAFSQTPSRRPIKLDDLYRESLLEDAQCSPEGNWVAYTVTTLDRESDKSLVHLWMASWDGSQDVQLTHDDEPASSPRWSPDGKYLSFVSSRAAKTKGSQIWLLDRRGGEARQLTHLKSHTITGYDWSPDSKSLLLVLREKDEPDEDEKPAGKPKPPKPVVIDRYHFKEDIDGYLSPSAIISISSKSQLKNSTRLPAALLTRPMPYSHRTARRSPS